MQVFKRVIAFIVEHKKAFIITGSIVIGVIGITVGIIAIVIANTPKLIYQPVNACDLLTFDEAKSLLGDKTFNGVVRKPVTGIITATSLCGYSDLNPDTNVQKVAAASVRTGLNDDGVRQNKTQFAQIKAQGTGITKVPNVGDDAFFDATQGQLNILSGKRWIILSYGIGNAPQGNTLDDSLALAKLVLN